MSLVKQLLLAGTLSCCLIAVANPQKAMAESPYDSTAVNAADRAFGHAIEFSGSSGDHYKAYQYAYYGWLYAYYADRYDHRPYWYYAYYYNYYAYYYASRAYKSDMNAGFWLTTPTSGKVKDASYQAYVYSYYAYALYR